MRIVVQSQSRQIVPKTLPQKYPAQRRVDGTPQVIGHLPSKREAGDMRSNPSAAKKIESS
jgi:hypothetical protein